MGQITYFISIALSGN